MVACSVLHDLDFPAQSIQSRLRLLVMSNDGNGQSELAVPRIILPEVIVHVTLTRRRADG